jgi:hypothetical protein
MRLFDSVHDLILSVDTTTFVVAELEIQEEVTDENKHIMKLGLKDLD